MARAPISTHVVYIKDPRRPSPVRPPAYYSARFVIYLDNAASTQPAPEVLDARARGRGGALRQPRVGARRGGGGGARAGRRPRRGGGGAGRRARGDPVHQRRHRGRRAGRAGGGARRARAPPGRERARAPGGDALRRRAGGATASRLDVVAPAPRTASCAPDDVAAAVRPDTARGRGDAGQQRARARCSRSRRSPGGLRRPARAAAPAPARRRGAGGRAGAGCGRARWAPTASRCPRTSCTARAAPGALWLRPGARLAPLWVRRRPGARPARAAPRTCPRWSGFGRAAALARARRRAAPTPPSAALRDRLGGARCVARACPRRAPHRAPAPPARPAHRAARRCPGLPAEPLLHALEARGVFASAGSACASRTRGPQPRAGGDRRRRPRGRAALLAVAPHHRRRRRRRGGRGAARGGRRGGAAGGAGRRRGGRRAGRTPRAWTASSSAASASSSSRAATARRFERVLADNVRARAAPTCRRARVEQPARPAAGAAAARPTPTRPPPGWQRVFGLVSLSVARQVDGHGRSRGDRRRPPSTARAPRSRAIRPPRRFKIEARRADKRFPLTLAWRSAAAWARACTPATGLPVDVHTPALRRRASRSGPTSPTCSPSTRAAPGGLPVGASGRALLLLSGGIDSPVAGWLAAKRGLALDARLLPLAALRRREVPRQGAHAGARSSRAGRRCARCTSSPSPRCQKRLRDAGPAELAVVLYRRMMMRVADAIADRLEATGAGHRREPGPGRQPDRRQPDRHRGGRAPRRAAPAGHLRQGRDHRARPPHRHLRDVDPALRGLLLAVRARRTPRPRARARSTPSAPRQTLDVAAEVAAAVAGGGRATFAVSDGLPAILRRMTLADEARAAATRSSPATGRRWSASRAASTRRCCCGSRTTCSATAAWR